MDLFISIGLLFPFSQKYRSPTEELFHRKRIAKGASIIQAFKFQTLSPTCMHDSQRTVGISVVV